MIERLKSLPKDELSLGRIVSAGARRLANIPHNVLWNLGLEGSVANRAKLRSLNSIHRHERCFIIGNGPSLRGMNLEPLRNEFTFGLNRIYLLFPELGFETSYWVAMNNLVIKQSVSEIRKLSCPIFLNWSSRKDIGQSNRNHYIRELYRPNFALDISLGMWVGATVTFAALQIAYYMGFSKVVLIGVDHRYSASGTPHKVVRSDTDDSDHFDSSYFGKGVRWQLPDLTTSGYAYQLARSVYEADGREIVDATVDGALTVFPKASYKEIIGQ